MVCIVFSYFITTKKYIHSISIMFKILIISITFPSLENTILKYPNEHGNPINIEYSYEN